MAKTETKSLDPDDLKTCSLQMFESLFKAYYRPLVVFALKYVNDMETAKEIVQEFFVRLYEKRHTIAIDTSLKSYLYRSVYNSCLNQIMHREIHQRHLKNMAGQTEDVYTDNQLATLELQNRIYECIEGLPEQCKRIFRMNRIEGLKNEQIARQLNLSKRTVETQISKALKILRKKLADYFLWIILLKLFIT